MDWTSFSLIFKASGVSFWRFWAIFGYFQSIKKVFGPFNPGFEGVTKVTKNGFIIIFRYFHGPKSLILVFFGVFGQFLGIFSPSKGYFDLFTPGLGGSQKWQKWIYYGFHPFSRPLESHFWRFLAFLANFWRFSAQKVIFRLIDPGFGGVTKVIKIDIFIREKLGILGKLCPRNLCSDDDNYLFQTLA